MKNQNTLYIDLKTIRIMKTILSFLLVLFSFFSLFSQELGEFFEDENNNFDYTIPILMDTGATSYHVWQIGVPHKPLFDEAASIPNAILTDTINNYPENLDDSFTILLDPMDYGIIYALQWNQKLDLDSAKDFGIIEFSTDTGNTWSNVFDNPFVYNFYGFELENQMNLTDSTYAFSGRDTTWQNVWLCFDYYFYENPIQVKFTIQSDSINNNNEGWMMDNFLAHITGVHTINDGEQKEYLQVYPNVTTGRVFIEARKIDDKHKIEKMELFDSSGRLVETFGESPTKFFIDIDHHSKGNYILKIQTNIKTESFQIILQ